MFVFWSICASGRQDVMHLLHWHASDACMHLLTIKLWIGIRWTCPPASLRRSSQHISSQTRWLLPQNSHPLTLLWRLGFASICRKKFERRQLFTVSSSGCSWQPTITHQIHTNAQVEQANNKGECAFVWCAFFVENKSYSRFSGSYRAVWNGKNSDLRGFSWFCWICH